MIASGISSGLAGLFVITGLLVWAIGIWLLVLFVRFLRSGREAFDRYLDMTSDPIRPPTRVSRAVVHPPLVSSEPTTEPSGGRRRKPGVRYDQA
jgi:hypothetical protein